jgi:predicted kinase
MARAFLEPSPVRLVAIGGRSGSGKSTGAALIAPRLAPAPGAVVLRSDVIRKRLFGVRPDTRLGPEAYTDATNRLVYESLADQARTIIAAGSSVIIDAVFARVDDRRAIAQVARDTGVTFTGLWLDAPAQTLRDRVEARSHDASDATTIVVNQQLASIGTPTEWHVIDASGSEADTLARIITAAPFLESLSAG